MSSISPIGVEEFKRRISEQPVTPPDGMTVSELTGWLNGYATCQKYIFEIIDKMFKDMRG
jgi:hypothetical protein